MRWITTTVLAAALAAPALAPATADDCLRARQIDGFRDIDDTGLTLVARKTKWRAEFASSCDRIKTALRIEADARGTCFEAGDALLYVRGGFEDRCVISSVTRIETSEPEN